MLEPPLQRNSKTITGEKQSISFIVDLSTVYRPPGWQLLNAREKLLIDLYGDFRLKQVKA